MNNCKKGINRIRIVDCISEENVGPIAMKEFLTEAYYVTDAMPKVLSPEIIDKLENDVYSSDEIEALYWLATKRYDALLGL
ncbi:hypothetical protein [Methanolobus sp.]|uniref:hypothetical protein n=1 Tax=Methanolobus sp. TaxID=1874737 RepID=UPI0025F6B935|nr:hypothetical protein [Methanolobus sp.]